MVELSYLIRYGRALQLLGQSPPPISRVLPTTEKLSCVGVLQAGQTTLAAHCLNANIIRTSFIAIALSRFLLGNILTQWRAMAVYDESAGDGQYGGRPSRPYEGGTGLPRRPSTFTGSCAIVNLN
jgi:hypothetical protein